jgi:hypothetical protein
VAEQPAHTPDGSEDPRAAKTVRRWRRAFLGIYLAFTFGAVLVAFMSTLAVHCGGRSLASLPHHKGPRIRTDAADPNELRGCQAELDRLLRELHREAFTVQQKALRFDTDPASEWTNWSAAWRARWQALDYRCRFSEGGGKTRSPEIDKMANIHKALEELQFAYSGLVSSFAGTYVDRLRHLRSQLQEVRESIDRRKPADPGADPETRGAR